MSLSEPDPHPLDRTKLSWQRTSLAIAATGLVLAKLFFEQAPLLSAIAIAVTLTMATVTWRASRRRLATIQISPASDIALPFSGRTGIALSVSVSTLALATVAAVLSGTIQW